MRIIITGGTGLIGRPLAASLLQDKHEVIVLSRTPDRRGGLSSGVRVVGWDGRSAAGWGQYADGAGAIINLAGAGIADSRWSEQRKREIVESRINAGQAVIEAVRGATTRPSLVIQASAVGYYGSRGGELLNEESTPGSDFLADVCIDWEKSTEAVEALGVRRAVIRTGIVLSAEGGALPKMLLPFKFFAGGKLGDGRQYFPWIHMADEVDAIRFLIDTPQASGPFNLAAPNAPTNAAFVKAVGEAMGRPSAVPAPSFALKAAFGEMSTVLLDGQRAEPKRLLGLGYHFRFTDPAAAVKNVLGK